MKIIAIGDIHGRDYWKSILNKEIFDKVIFIGDYFDSFDIPGDIQCNNFADIIQFKKDNMDKVILLTGNHDFHYMGYGEQYSGFQHGYQYSIGCLLDDNKNLLQMSYAHNNILFTHAGVSTIWLRNNGYDGGMDLNNINLFINDLFKYKPNKFKFTIGKNYSQTGNDICQTPIWIRPESLVKDMVGEFKQVVGHTQKIQIHIDMDLILIDALNSSEYLIIEDGIISVGKI
jgi:predicted MPP superfamily phosphohydrolase